jgi:hypothetical protein
MSKYRRSDRLIMLNQDKIIADDIPDKITRNPNLMESDGIDSDLYSDSLS